jgi:phospholipid N-methyltransferase
MSAKNWTLADRFKTDFINAVELAIDTNLISFRRDPHIGLVIENSTRAGALEDIAYINKYHDMIWSWAEKFRTSDQIGEPFTFEFPVIGKFSPTTIRYIKAICDLIENFGSLNNLHIAEIGPGYGGFCKIIHDVFKPASYTSFDLPQCFKFQERFLANFNIKLNKGIVDQPNTNGYDLVIAACSYSELTMDARIEYIDNVLRYSKKGYFILNYNTRENIELIIKMLTNVHDTKAPRFSTHDHNPTILMFK